MTETIIIGLDAMSGTNAPASIVKGAAAAAQSLSDIKFAFFGDKEKIEPLVSVEAALKGRYDIIHTTVVIKDEEQPIRALRNGTDSSMRLAIDAVKSKGVHVCISCGNTGALMVMAKMVLGDLHGIKRPAITSIFPSKKGGVVLLDIGANSECDEQVLSQFAVMGMCYAQAVLNISNPRIGLLNIGAEKSKGRDVEKKTYDLLANSSLNFIGNVEPYDTVSGNVDVVVTDGFTGNITIKVAEASSMLCLEFLKRAFISSFFAKIIGLLAKSYIKQSLSHIDHRKYNGAMFLGVDGIVVKSHGSSDYIAFENAVKIAYNLATRQINTQISQQIAAIEEQHIGFVDKIKKTFGF